MLLYHSLVERHVIKLRKLYHAKLLMVYMLNYVKCTQIIDIIDRHAYEIDGVSMDVKCIQRKKESGCMGAQAHMDPNCSYIEENHTIKISTQCHVENWV